MAVQIDTINRRIQVDEEFTIYQVTELRAAFLEMLQKPLPVTMDFSTVQSCDTAAVQLMVAARRAFTDVGCTLTVKSAPAFSEAGAKIGLVEGSG